MADSPDTEKAWRPERPKKNKVKRIKPSQCHQYEILYHADPYEIFLPSKKVKRKKKGRRNHLKHFAANVIKIVF